MPMRVSSLDKKAEIARDIVVAYLSHMDANALADLDKVRGAIERLVGVVDETFEVPERGQAGFGISPTIPPPVRHHDED